MTRFICAVALLFLARGAAAQPAPTPEQIKAMAEKLQAGPEHRVLAALEGNWSLDITYNVGAPQPLRSKGTATNRMILGGRFLVSEAVSENPAGPAAGDQQIESMGIYGFDRRTSEYTTIGLDTMGTYWVAAAGTMKPDRTIVMSGESLDDHGGQREMRRYDMVLKIVDRDTYITQIIFKFSNRPDLTIVETTHRRIR
jgi:hypothetical protein